VCVCVCVGVCVRVCVCVRGGAGVDTGDKALRVSLRVRRYGLRV
jgi:hypothetical protein